MAAGDHFAIETRPAWCAIARTDRVGGAQCKSVAAPIDVPPFDRANVDAISRPSEMVALTKRRSGRVLAADVSSPFVAVLAGLIDPTFKDRLREEVPKNLERILASIFGAAAALVFFRFVFEKVQHLNLAIVTTLIFDLCTSVSAGTSQR